MRSLFILLATLATAFAGEKPNIVFILADDLGIGDVRAFNKDSKIPTPNLDRLAAGGMKFTDAHTPSSVCTPTRYGLLTGRYNWRAEAREGIGDGVGWRLWPSSDDLKAIGHGFGGRSVMDGCVVREKIQYFCTYSHKKGGVRAAHFF